MSMAWTVISWLGSFGFAVCAIPQVISTWRAGHARELSWGFLLLWLLGEVCTFAYVLHEIDSPPLIVNYVINGLCLLILIWYKLRPRTSPVSRILKGIIND